MDKQENKLLKRAAYKAFIFQLKIHRFNIRNTPKDSQIQIIDDPTKLPKGFIDLEDLNQQAWIEGHLLKQKVKDLDDRKFYLKVYLRLIRYMKLRNKDGKLI